jgi:glycosyltransferase A (GT-A) superfamily protein (DUF2064 family)
MTAIIVIAKETIPGRVKTRLHPPFSLEQAAQLAAASLDDTLRAVSSLGASERILYFDGDILPPGSEGYRVIPQTSGTLDERLAAVFDQMTGPTLLVGMDTPQLSYRHLAHLFENWPTDIDAWFGPAEDGGFWALGLREPNGDLIRGVPMSQDDTGARQLDRLDAAGLMVALLPTLTDVDTIDSAEQVAAIAPHTEFAKTLNRFAVREPSGASGDHRALQTAGALR